MSSVTGDYHFSAEPRTVQNRELKYREPEEVLPSNIMFDRRVVRGNTYASMIVPDSSRQDMERRERLDKAYHARMVERRREAEVEAKLRQQREDQESPRRSGSPSEAPESPTNEGFDYDALPVEGESPTHVQGEFFIDRPPSPQFLPESPGLHKATQIEHDELFDFELEVEPVLQVLVGKSLEQGRMEVLEEQELHSLVVHHAQFAQQRNAELGEVQRVEAKYSRRQQESERRQLQALTRRQQMVSAHQKYVTRITAKRFLQTLPVDALEELEALGTYADPAVTALHEQLLPWILQQTNSNIHSLDESSALLTFILKTAIHSLQQRHHAAKQRELDTLEEEHRRVLQREQETAQRKRQRDELRAVRRAEQERTALETLVFEELIRLGTRVDNVTAQPFADIDSYSTTQAFGTPGGRTGEFLNLLATVEEALCSELTQVQVSDLLLSYVTTCMKTEHLAFTVDAECYDAFCERVECQQAGFYALPEEAQQEFLCFLLDPANGEQGTTLADMRTNPSLYSLPPHLHELFTTSVYQMIVAKNEPTGEEEEVNNPIRGKILLNRAQRPEEERKSAVAAITITSQHRDLEEDEEDKKESETRSKPETELEDRDLLVACTTNELSVFVVSEVPQRLLRRELCAWVHTVKGFEHLEPAELYQRLNERGNKYQEQRLRVLAPGLHHFSFYI